MDTTTSTTVGTQKGIEAHCLFFYLQVHKYEDTCSFSILTLAFKFTFQWE